MMVQNRYQRRRMYTRIALGKNRAMDVVSGESSGGSGQLLFLYPLLFALQILQCWIGELHTHVSDKWVPCLRTHPPLSCPYAEVPVSTACLISHTDWLSQHRARRLPACIHIQGAQCLRACRGMHAERDILGSDLSRGVAGPRGARE